MNKSIKYISIASILGLIAFISVDTVTNKKPSKSLSQSSASFKDYFQSNKKAAPLSDNYWTSGKFNMTGI
ncbi:MAG: hypothetical protein U9Q04_09855 [Campylobacterota bacterium]|nr:hypothetical protein [Campylobacterota bacterium]